MTVRKLTHMAVLTAVALTIFVLEAQLPPLVPMVPGIKLGLTNVVTVYALFALGPGPAAMILLARVVLGSLFAGGSTIFYSLAGGVCCFLAMALLRLVMTEKQMWACSALGGNMMTDAFGIVAMVAMTPLVTIQTMGLYSQIQHALARRRLRYRVDRVEDAVVYFD